MMVPPPPAAPPPLLAQKPSRRGLLKAFGVGGVLLVGGTWVWNTVGRFGPPAPGRLVFDADEYRTLEKACEALFPGKPDWPYSAAEVDTPKFVDTYVHSLYPDHHQLFRVLLRTLNISPIVAYGRSFYWLPVQKRLDVLNSWATSDIRLRRAGYQSLTFAIKLGYFEDDRVRASAGFTNGCGVPQDGRPWGHGGPMGKGGALSGEPG